MKSAYLPWSGFDPHVHEHHSGSDEASAETRGMSVSVFSMMRDIDEAIRGRQGKSDVHRALTSCLLECRRHTVEDEPPSGK